MCVGATGQSLQISTITVRNATTIHDVQSGSGENDNLIHSIAILLIESAFKGSCHI
jgi:hypothetical protein